MRYSPVVLFLALPLCAGGADAFDVQGHRGARGLAPENTIAAFRRAIEFDVSTIETDVAISADDIPVLVHDRRLNPAITRDRNGQWLTAPGPPVRSLSYAMLQTYDVGRINPATSYAGQWPAQTPDDGARIPSLAALFALVGAAGAPVRFNLETKLSPFAAGETADPATFARVIVEAVVAAGVASRTTIQSFDWRTLLEVKRLAPELRTACLTQEGGNGDTVRADASGRSPWHAGLSFADAGHSLPKLVKSARCDTWSPFWRNASPARIREAQALGLAVIPWTVNEPADMKALIDAGVDGLITDYPDRLRALLGSSAAQRR